MVAIAAGRHARSIVIVGHGLTIPERFELRPGVFLEPKVPSVNLNEMAKNIRRFREYAAVVSGHEIANFSVEIHQKRGGKTLAVKAWNSLWLFHLLALACDAPAIPLYSYSDGGEKIYTSVNPNIIINPIPKITTASLAQLFWAKKTISFF